jgi:hypothetical protein
VIKLSVAPQRVDDTPRNLELRAMTITDLPSTNHRAIAFLRAIGAGRGTLRCSCEPDLYIDGLSCGDQFTAHELAHWGLMSPSRPGLLGELVPAALTDAGRAALAN